MSNDWECVNCAHKLNERPTYCTSCGMVQAGKWSHQKYEILESYCHPLSLIMRNQGFAHFFIDACAGSGIVQSVSNQGVIDGSPLLMAKTRHWVEKTIRDKAKEPQVQCKFIEVNTKTFEILKSNISDYSHFSECYLGDCNELLPKILDKIPSAFTFIYIDPFGLGDPVIQYPTIEMILERKFTELFIHYSLEGVSRVAGQLKNIDHPTPTIRKMSRSSIQTMNEYMGGEDWQETWRKASKTRREETILQEYLSTLKSHYKHIESVEIPIGSKRPIYYLIFTTRNDIGKKIMNEIILSKRRKKTAPLEKWQR